MIGCAEVERSSPIGGTQKADMKFLEQTKFVTNGELEKHNTLRGSKILQVLNVTVDENKSL